MSECYYDYHSAAQHTDATPHINIGREFQARVKKWADREITDEEREAIEERDEMVFDSTLIDHLSPEQLNAYELLSCSQAVPRPGRNKELALQLLMENKGNLEAAVMDFVTYKRKKILTASTRSFNFAIRNSRSDTLDWEQYRSIYDSYYPDTTPWSAEEILSFQDALYKTEKDFHQVAQELTNKTVRECVEFYYTWKKACPDDYRKLRNLRRKRQLLEIHQQMETERDPCPIPAKQRKLSEDDTEGGSEQNSFMQQSPSSSMTPIRKTSDLAAPHVPMQQMHSPSIPHHHHPGSSKQPNTQPSARHGSVSSGSKKGAQPSADGFFHCRLCDKCFEKVKSLNAHMKSHAMKARAEAEAQAQVQAQAASSPLNLNAIAAQNLATQAIEQQLGFNPAAFQPGALNLPFSSIIH
ncbi:unnamed protein product, partial [Mesorhabditis spiculigera]